MMSQNAFETVLHEKPSLHRVDVKSNVGYCDLACNSNYTQKAHSDGLGCEKPVRRQREVH
ncbi:hypothetical protein E2C01_047459 [Portunus trituberculatus]|uniref:Uncharacterized protein n=1 Tax=Portunus trituberculatus TaxID=210409 RepID=A0A5B7GAJ5_PORTR|nr:hypothetical protein [Portunus trituberculatus]